MNPLTILENAQQAAQAKHGEGVSFRCMTCKQVKSTGGHGGGTGYARPQNSDGLLCYACADAAQIEGLKDRSKPFSAYLSSDGNTVTSWTGGKLMTVTRSTPCALTRQSFMHDSKSYRSIRARDVHGAYWFGRGSAGVCLRLRACKS